ncbi:MAG: hypothetical protein JW726_04970 [Anaerolineales bacterium]|nr:hypothetical protein [Anaerolineales bacterium]
MWPLFLSALMIFAMRVVDISLYTMRIMMVMRGRKGLAWLFAFCQSVVYVTAIRAVLSNLDNWMNVVGYAAGFATGNVIGIMIESKLAMGHIHLRIISSGCGDEITETLRQNGFAVTETAGHGRNGTVSLLYMDVLRRDVELVTKITEQCDAKAFIMAQNVRPLQRGFWHHPNKRSALWTH